MPSQPGGGTVGEEHREEGGTAAILESIRCGLAFRLKSSVGVSTIEELEHAMVRQAMEIWSGNPAIRGIGSPRAERSWAPSEKSGAALTLRGREWRD